MQTDAKRTSENDRTVYGTYRRTVFTEMSECKVGTTQDNAHGSKAACAYKHHIDCRNRQRNSRGATTRDGACVGTE